MPEIKFTQGQLDAVQNKFGVYTALKNKKVVHANLRMLDQITKCIENAFREFCQKHKGMTKELEEKKWEQFQKILQRHL